MGSIDKPVKYPMPQCLDYYGLKPCTAEYLEKMRCIARECSYDVKSFFQQHDPLEFGNVTEHIFKCVMHEKWMCQAGFSMDIIQLLTEFFQMPDGKICYMRLVELMNSSANIADQLRECASKVPFPQISDAPLLTCGKRVFGTETCIPAILERLRNAYWRLKINFFDLWRCSDPNCQGTVSEEKFKCILNDTLVPEAGITERQLDAVANFYRAYDNEIDYKRMGDMFDSTLSLQEQYLFDYATNRGQLKKPKAVNCLCPAEECKLRKIWIKVVQRADPFTLKYIHAIFDKFAQRPSGDTSVPHLKRFIEYLKVDLVESDFKLLCKKYATNDYNVNFLQLIEDLDDAFHEHVCPKPPKEPILGANGPPEMEYTMEEMGDGADQYSSIWGPGACHCDNVDEGLCLVADSSRFYEGGPVAGGNGRRPVLGRNYVKKRMGAHPGQGYAGDYAMTPGAGLASVDPVRPETLTKIVAGASESVELKSLMERLQQFLYRYRIRNKEFFKDFDPLNTGTVTANRFRRALATMGISSLGRFDLSEGEFDALINYYRLNTDPDMVCWKKYDDDIESIFITKGLEKTPAALTPDPYRIAHLPSPGVIDPEDVPLNVRQLANCAVARLKHRVRIESSNIKNFFSAFDVTNNGYITRHQFEQTLGMLNYNNFSREELDAISVIYSDDKGFYYFSLMDDLEPTRKLGEVGWYARYKAARIYNAYTKPTPPVQWQEHDIHNIMYKCHNRMVTHRPKIKQFFQDHDWINHNRLKIVDFHRVLDVCGFYLSPREVEVLTCCFQSPNDPMSMEWRVFQDTLERVFTIEALDKAPRLTPQQWRPIKQMDKDKCLCPEDYCLYKDGMRRLARQVYIRRIEFRNVFKDFDIPKCGIVTEDQFHRVLHTLGIRNCITPHEFSAIVKRFSTVRPGHYPGCKIDVDYTEFLIQLDSVVYVDPLGLPEMSPTGVEWHKQLHPVCDDCEEK